MKKVLAALAVLAISTIGFTAFAADDEAPTVKGNVEVYGAAKLSYDIITTDSKAADADKTLQRVSSNSSRLGFKDKEDLGDGLSAVMQLELGVNYDGTQTSVATAVTNTTTGATKNTNIDKITYRNSYAGLSSEALGTLIFGINDTPYKISTGGLDPFGDTMGDYNAIIGTVNGTADFDLRAKDTVMYTTPKIAGFQIMAQTGQTGKENSNNAAGNAGEYSASVMYSGGPVYAALAYETHRNGYGSFDAATKETGTKAGVGLTFGGTKLGLVYEKLKNDLPNSPFTRDAFYVSAAQKFGNETIKLAYGKANDGESTASTGANMMAIGLDHSFSKRTAAYILYAKTKNDSGATYGLGQSGAGGAFAPTNGGESPSVVSIGLNHSF